MPSVRALAISACLLTAPVCAQLAGTYIINPTLPLSAVTFPSFADAIAALDAQGVSGPCEFLIYDDAGPYTESSQFVANNAGGTYGFPTGTAPDAVVVMNSWTGTSAANRVTFRPASGERVVLDAAGLSCGIFWGGADYVTVEGLEIRGAAYDGISLYAESTHGIANDPIIDSCRIHDIGGPAVTIYGNSAQPANTLVQNCTMWSCQLTGGGAFGTTGRFGYISTRRTNGTRIVHNTFYADSLSNNVNYCVLGSRASSAAEVPFAEVSNNVFVKIAAAGAPLFRMSTPTGSTSPLPTLSESNVFFDVSGGTFALYGANAGTTAATLGDWQLLGVDVNSIAADPLFRDSANDDFHLTAPSPALGASTIAAGVADDADGQPRSTPFDIGADEFSAGDYALIGMGCAGSSNLTAELDLWSWPFLGNAEFTIGFEQLSANQLVALFGSLGVSPVPLPIGAGCEAYLDVGSFVGLAATISGPGGTASFVLPIPSNPAFAGFNLGYQGVALDAGAALGFTTTNGVDVTFDF